MKFNQFAADLISDIHGISGQFAILNGVTLCQIRGVAIAMRVKHPWLHTEDLCCNTLLMPSHIDSTVTTLPSTSVPLDVHLK